MHKTKKLIAMLLALSMLAGMMIIPASAAVTPGISIKMESAPNGAHKLVVSATSEGLNAANVILSYDSKLIEAVSAKNQAAVAIVNGSTNPQPFGEFIKDVYETDYGPLVNWVVQDNRTGFQIAVKPNDPTAKVVANLSDTPIFSFYFKTKGDLSKGSFKIETDKGAGSILSVLYKTEASLKGATGVLLSDKSGTNYEYIKSNTDTLAVNLTYTGSDKQTLGGLTIGAIAGVNVPTSGTAASAKPTVIGTDTDGDPMVTLPAQTWSIDGAAPTGVSIHAGTGVLTLTNQAQSGSVTIKVSAGGKSATQTITITRAAPVNTAVKIFDGAAELATDDTLLIPTSTTPNTKQYSAKTYDQYGAEVAESYTWTLTPADAHVTLTGSTVSVAKGAAKDKTYQLKAVGGTSTLSKEITIKVKDIEVTWTAVAAKTEITYGTAKKDAFTKLPATGTATAGENKLEGAFSIVAPAEILAAGATQTITVQFKVTTAGAYKDVVITKDYTVKVNPKSIANVTVGAIDAVTYNGAARTPAALTVKDGSLPDLTATKDYTLTYANNTNAGTAKVVLTGAGNYTGKKEVTFTIKKATITGITTVAPAHTVLANATANTSLAALKAIANNGAALPANVTVNFAGGTAELPIVWANSADVYNIKGGVYTYKGTVTPGTNFEAYATTLNAKMTVAPVTGIISKVDGAVASALKTPVTVAKAKASAATNYAALKLPASIELTFDGGVPAATYNNLTFSVPLATLKAAAVDSTTQVSITSIPAWVTIDPAKLAVAVKITAKYPVTVTVTPPTGVTYGTALGDPTSAQVADEDGTDGGAVTWTYLYEGKTAADVAYSSAEKPTQAGTYTVTATLVSTTHAGSQKSAPFTIAKKELADSMIAVTGTYTYNTKPIIPTYTVTDAKLLKASDYKAVITDNTNAGTAKITVTAEAKGNYSGTVAKTFTIAKAPLADLTPVIAGTAQVGKVLTANLKDMADSELTWQWLREDSAIGGAIAKTYIITAADSNKKITVKAVAAEAGNYSGTSKATAAVTVPKIELTGAVSIAISNGASAVEAKIDATDTLTATITAILPAEARAGATYQWYRNGTAIKTATAAAYTVTAEDAAAVLKVVVTPAADFTGTAEASVEVGKTALTGTLTLSGTTTVGQTLTATYNNAVPLLGTDYTITWMRGGTAISGATAMTYKITAEDQGKSVTAKVTAKGATYTGEILSDSKAISAAVPAAPAVTASAGDKQVTFSWTAPADNGAPVTGYVIQVDGGAAVNVGPDVLTRTVTGLTNGVECVITVAAVNSVGTGATGTAKATPAEPYYPPTSSGSNTNTETKKNEDGSTTTTVTNKRTGTVTETTKFSDGSKSIVETKKDGTVATTDIRKDGLKAETVTTPTGTTTATITVPQNVDSAWVSLPVKDAKPGTVAVLIKADGTKEIIKKSVAKDGKVTFPIDASAKIEIIDNSKHFEDVKENDWFAASVAFASAHELFSGTGEKTFDPTADMNRGMLITVMHRLENLPKGGDVNFEDVPAGAYYAEAAAWAKENKIVTGTGSGLDPDANVTRESLVVMLYRYAKVEKSTGDLTKFSDGDKVSSWAVDAMSWAVQAGILQGAGGALNPAGNATRAEVATMMQRFVEFSVK